MAMLSNPHKTPSIVDEGESVQLSAGQIRLRVANMLIGQGMKVQNHDLLRKRLNEIFRAIVGKGTERMQLRYEIVVLARERGLDLTSGEEIIQTIEALDAVIMDEKAPKPKTEKTAKASGNA